MIERDIIFFDGICGFCNRTVDYVMLRDRTSRFLFSPLQGETFREVLDRHPELSKMNSLFVLRRAGGTETVLTRSEATLYIFSEVPGHGWIARLGRIVPRALRDSIYSVIAAIRYKIWGQRSTCRLPTPGEQARFLP